MHPTAVTQVDERTLDDSRLLSVGRQNADSSLMQATQRNRKDCSRRFVEPLEIIERQNDRTLPGQLDQDIQHTQTDCPRVRRRRDVVAEEQRHLQRPTPWRGDLIRNHVQYRGDQIDECGERESVLGLDASMLEYPVAGLPTQLNSALPQRRLADPWISRKHQTNWVLG